MKKSIFQFLLLFLIVLAFSCTRDQVEPATEECEEAVTYENQIKDIIDKSCAYASCHLNAAPGVYDSYDGLKSSFDSGKFKSRVLDIRDMPPIYSENGPNTLTAEELKLITCWFQDGYPE